MRERIKATKDDWEISEMPAKQEKFSIKRRFSKEKMEHLSFGHIPCEMEDKWFFYMEDNQMFIHRSWSGACIYILTFRKHGMIDVIVNRDPNQYTCSDIQEDVDELNNLLDIWC